MPAVVVCYVVSATRSPARRCRRTGCPRPSVAAADSSTCWFDPSAFITQISYAPLRSLMKAICLPSGDQAGAALFQDYAVLPASSRRRSPSSASRSGAPRRVPSAFSTWTSQWSFCLKVTAIFLPSGEKTGPRYAPLLTIGHAGVSGSGPGSPGPCRRGTRRATRSPGPTSAQRSASRAAGPGRSPVATSTSRKPQAGIRRNATCTRWSPTPLRATVGCLRRRCTTGYDCSMIWSCVVPPCCMLITNALPSGRPGRRLGLDRAPHCGPCARCLPSLLMSHTLPSVCRECCSSSQGGERHLFAVGRPRRVDAGGAGCAGRSRRGIWAM